jgi:type IV pilus assembly protein PilZ
MGDPDYQSGFKPQGFAIQLSGDKGIYYKTEAERVLAGSMSLYFAC